MSYEGSTVLGVLVLAREARGGHSDCKYITALVMAAVGLEGCNILAWADPLAQAQN